MNQTTIKISELLKSLREKRKLTKEQLAKELKTTLAQIEILENGEFNKLTFLTLKKILEKYEKFFNLNSGELTSLIKEENTIKEKNIFQKISFRLPTNFNFLLPLILIIIFITIVYQLYRLILPPQIYIISPKNEMITNEKKIIIKGYTNPNAILFINRQEVLKDKRGYFEVEAFLMPGLNKFEFEAKNYLGLKNKKIIKVYFQGSY
jgi:transcriptional regulator with XRE-family HTH domain